MLTAYDLNIVPEILTWSHMPNVTFSELFIVPVRTKGIPWNCFSSLESRVKFVLAEWVLMD